MHHRRSFVIKLLFSILPLLSVAALQASERAPVTYEVSVSGPLANFSRSCADPCQISQVEQVGEVGPEMKQSESIANSDQGTPDGEAQCFGNCKKKKTQLVVSSGRTLREGFEVTIEDQWAHFIFYTVVETASGPATKRSHHEFRVDRPLIAVSLGDHEVELRASVEQDPDTVRKRTEER